MAQGFINGFAMGSQLGESIFGGMNKARLLKYQNDMELERQKGLERFKSDLTEDKENRILENNRKALELLFPNKPPVNGTGLSNGLMDLGIRHSPAMEGEYMQAVPKEGGGFSFTPSGEKFSMPETNRTTYIAPMGLKPEGQQQLAERADFARNAIGNNPTAFSAESMDRMNKISRAGSLSQDMNLINPEYQGQGLSEKDAFIQNYLKTYGGSYLTEKGGLIKALKEANKEYLDYKENSFKEIKNPLEIEKLQNDIGFQKKHREYVLEKDRLMNEYLTETNPLKKQELESRIKALDIKNSYAPSLFQSTLDNGVSYRNNVNFNQQPTVSSTTTDSTTGEKRTVTRKEGQSAPTPVIPPYKPLPPPKRK